MNFTYTSCFIKQISKKIYAKNTIKKRKNSYSYRFLYNTSNIGIGKYMSTYFKFVSSDPCPVLSSKSFFIFSSGSSKLNRCSSCSPCRFVKIIFLSSLFHILQTADVHDNNFTGSIALPIRRLIRLLFPAVVSPKIVH